MWRNGAAARVISESEELLQGVKIFLLPVRSLLAVAKSSSFSSEDVGQQSVEAACRWRPLQAVFCLDRSSWSRPWSAPSQFPSQSPSHAHALGWLVC